MYIEELLIRNVKLIRDQTISFLRGDRPRMWTVIVGENGTCKTTILQAIALAASGPDASNRITSAVPFPDQRRSHGARMHARFGFGVPTVRGEARDYPHLDPRTAMPPRIRSEMVVIPGWDFFAGGSWYCADPEPLSAKDAPDFSSKEDPLRDVRGRGLARWLVAGYGTTRALPVPRSIEKPTNTAVERLRSLFEPVQIIGTGFADFLTDNLVKEYVKTLKSALTKQDQILPRVRDLELRGRHGVRSASQLVESQRFAFGAAGAGKAIKIPATWLSQGYQAMIAWVADLIGQFFSDEGRAVPLDEMEGLVLIDELDIHLHPTWQRGLITALKATFPRVQFVVTTHTAMILPGLEADEILRTRFDENGDVVVEPVNQSPDYMTGSEILDTFFGVNALYPTEVARDLQRYGLLAGNPLRTDAEDAEAVRLLRDLKAVGVEPGFLPTPRKSPLARKSGSAKPRKRRGKRES